MAAAAAMPKFAEAAPAPSTSVPRVNWSGNYHYHTDKVFQPFTVADVQDAVRSVPHLRALGSRHSFNGIADSTDAQISMLGLKNVQVDPATKTARVGAGVQYDDLCVQLNDQGWALQNLASLLGITVGGACSTATHGSGVKNQNLASAVREIEFVAADGRVHVLSRARDGDRFAGAVVGLGALGVMTHMTLAIEPRFEMTQVVYQNLPFSELERHLPDIMGAAYSVSLFTHWQSGRAEQVWLKRRVDQGGTAALPPMFYGATLAKEKLTPMGPGYSPEACTDQQNQVGPWFERLPHFKIGFTPSAGHELQTEFFVPFDRGYEAIRAVETLHEQIAPHLFVTELRTVAPDDLWLSTAYKRRSLTIHFTWKPEWEAVLQVVPKIQAKLAPFAMRPHWAKVFTMPGAQVEPLYPRMNDFNALVKEYDPRGKFVNQYLRQEVFA